MLGGLHSTHWSHYVMSDITIKELAELIGRGVPRLRQLAREGKVPGVYCVGRRYYISKAAADKLRLLPTTK